MTKNLTIINQFIDKSIGEWKSIRSTHTLAFQEFENKTVDNSVIKEERYDIFANKNYINNDSCKNRDRLILKLLDDSI